MQNDGITTVVCGCDPVFPVYLTSRAAEQGYTPEWVVAGVALTDQDIVGQLFDQSEWSHAFGVTFNGPTVPKQNTFGYAAYKQVNPSTEPANAVDLIYAQMYEMAIGIQMAGPDLTPQTFENGMRAYPGSQAGASNALYGTWDFPAGHFTPQTDWSFIYWDPNKTSPYDDKAGAYVASTTRTKIGSYAGGALPCPPTSRSRRPAGASGRWAAPSLPRRPRLGRHAGAPARHRADAGRRPDPALRRPGPVAACGAAGQILNGAEFGAVNGLLALGLVLTYRASRVINFSYGAMGALAATVAVELNLAHHVNWFVCIGIALLVGAALGLLVDFVIRWRFFTAPRLIVMVVTIGLAQLFGGIQLLVPGWLSGPSIVGGVTTPLTTHHVLIFPVLFNGNDLLIAIVVPVVLVALGWFLLRTDAGVAVRSVADNSDRARLLGIPVRRLSTLVWVIAGLLAGLTSILSAPSAGITIAAGAGPTLILPALAAAIIAGMESLPLAFGAGVALGITSGLFEFNMPRYGSAVGDVVNLVAILAGLLFLQRKRSRADDAEESFSSTGILKPIPAVLRSLPEVVAGRIGIMALVGVVIVVIPLVSGPGTTLEYTAALIYGIIAISLVVLTGWSGNVSLGQFAFAGVGGVLAGDLIEKANADLFLSLAAAGVAGAALAVVVGIPALRIRGAYLAAVTLALGVAMDTFFLNPTYFPTSSPRPSCARSCGSASTWPPTRRSTSSAWASWS